MDKEKEARRESAYQFHLHARRLGYRIVKRISAYKYVLQDIDDFFNAEMVAIILPTSFDAYVYRLLKHHNFDLLIVQEHNAVVPATVLSMKTGIKYAPGDVDMSIRPDAKRRTEDEKKLLLSQIIVGTKDGRAALASMPARMRQRYVREAKSFLKSPVGRPLFSSGQKKKEQASA